MSNTPGDAPELRARAEPPAPEGAQAPDRTYDPSHFELLDRVEDTHFWFRARHRVIEVLARRALATFRGPCSVLELGCGNGGVLRTLRRACPGGLVVGMDLYAEGLRRARRRSDCPLVQGDVRQAPFGGTFALVGMFDVLEHLPDERSVLQAVRGLVSPGGALLVTVPAHMSLWSDVDVAADHRRRYSAPELRARLEENGFVVEYCSQFMAALYPIMWLSRRGTPVLRRLRRKGGRGEGGDGGAGGGAGGGADAGAVNTHELKVVPGLNGALAALLGTDAALVRRGWRLPIGTSLCALARRPG